MFNMNISGINKINSCFSNFQKEDAETAKEPVSVENMGLLYKEAIDKIFDPTSAMTEEQKQEFIKEIQRKIEKGEKLTYDEMQYLRINNPVEYAKMAKVQAKREALERRLENCKSKQEAQEVYVEAMSRVSREDTAIKETFAAYDNTMEEFKKSEQYKELPAEEKEKE